MTVGFRRVKDFGAYFYEDDLPSPHHIPVPFL
jgi:hypothetical protein